MQPGSYVILFHFQPPLLPLIWPLPILWLPIPLMPEKEHTCQKGFLAVNWAGIYNKSRAASVYRGHLTYAAFQGKAIDWAGPPYLLYCVPITTAHLYKGVPGILLRAETWPFQQDLHSYISICIFTDQSKKLHNDQSECVISTNQDSAHWTNQTVQIKIPHLHKSGPIRDQGGNLYKRASLPWAGPLSGACPPLPWVKSLLLLHPSPGTAVVIGLEVATFSWQHFISVACLIAWVVFACLLYLPHWVW